LYEFTKPREKHRKPATRRSKLRKKTCMCGIVNRNNRIIGGKITPKYYYPWMVRIMNGCGMLCTGALISRRHIATAYHCLKNTTKSGGTICDHVKRKSVIILGAHIHDVETKASKILTDGKIYKVGKFVHPPKPDLNQNDPESHDFAVYVLDQPVELSDRVMPICLPKNENEDYAGEKAIAAGWGDYRRGRHPNSKELRHVELTVSKTLQHLPKIFTTITAKNAAGEWADPCSGDSGGPLMKKTKNGRHVLIGTVQGGGYNCDMDVHGYSLRDSNQKYNKITAHLEFLKNLLGTDMCAFDY